MHDALGARMKEQYEHRTRILLPRRTYTLIRLDGKAFHTFTRGFERPFDTDLIEMMDYTAKVLCENIQGCKVAFVQSDEISLLLTDFDKITTDAYLKGNVQKIASISAAMAASAFAGAMHRIAAPLIGVKRSKFEGKENYKVPLFDSRVFTIPDPNEVENYFIWRQQDATKNSIQMVAQSLYSHKELHGKNGSQQQDMIHEKGQNWNDYPVGQKRGRAIIKETYEKEGATRSRWVVVDPPIFSKDRSFLQELIPRHHEGVQNENR